MQASRAIEHVLDMLDTDDRFMVLQEIRKSHGLNTDVARMYSDKEVAERYGVYVRTARDWIIKKKLKGCQIGSKWYSRADWLDEFDKQQALQTLQTS